MFSIADRPRYGLYPLRGVTEIPEHLLKRSRERRAAIGGGGADSDAGSAPETASTPASATAAATPATTPRPAAPAPVAPAPPPPKPDPAYVRAYKERKKIPYWALLGLAILPIWAFMYVRSLQNQAEALEGPLAIGQAQYGTCSSCHGATGQGGSGRKLSQGEVLKTFPAIEDQLRWVYFGTEEYEAAGVSSYGNPNREGGAHTTRSYNGTAMPAQGGALSDSQILGVVCYIRYNISGADPTSEEFEAEFERWCSPDSAIFAGLEDGSLTLLGLPHVGDAPAPGSATPYPVEPIAEG
jgi:mono/diheme cytochrome c family protein